MPWACNINEGSTSEFNLLSKNFLYKIIKSAAIIFFPSEEAKHRLEKYLLRKLNHSFIIPNSVDPTAFCKKRRLSCRKKLKLDRNIFIILYTGGDELRKGWSLVKKLIKGKNNYSFFLIGNYKKKVNSEKVLYQGLWPFKKMPLLYNSCNCLLLPTVSEGMSNCVVEANACKIPIITTKIQSNIAVLGPNYPFFVRASNLKNIQKAILRSQKLKYKSLKPFTHQQKACLLLAKIKKYI